MIVKQTNQIEKMMEQIFLGAFELIKDENVAGKCLWITKRRGMEYWPTPTEERKYLVNPSKLKSRRSHSAHSKLEIPHTFEKM